MTLPNFIIVGAGKSGTESMYYYLKQHPEVYMSPTKETNFFALFGEAANFQGPPDTMNDYSISDMEEYKAQFAGVASEKAIGEASPLYLYTPEAPVNIKQTLPEAKIVVILRNPVDRAFSCYLFKRSHMTETMDDFEQALEAEQARIDETWPWFWHYKTLGYYQDQLQRYYDLFDSEQVKVYLYDDFRADNIAVMQDLFGFIGVDDTFVPDVSLQHNFSGLPKNKFLQYILNGPNPVQSALKPLLPTTLRRKIVSKIKRKNLTKPTITPAMRKTLTEVYREDILKLEKLLDRDLSSWLQV